MYKVGVMLMGSRNNSPKKVKEVVLEVEGKTKINNIFDYLLDLGKISSMNVYITLEKGGRKLYNFKSISYLYGSAQNVKGTIRLYLYEDKDEIDSKSIKKSESDIAQQQKGRQDSNKPSYKLNVYMKNANKGATDTKSQYVSNLVEEPSQQPSGCCPCF